MKPCHDCETLRKALERLLGEAAQWVPATSRAKRQAWDRLVSETRELLAGGEPEQEQRADALGSEFPKRPEKVRWG